MSNTLSVAVYTYDTLPVTVNVVSQTKRTSILKWVLLVGGGLLVLYLIGREEEKRREHEREI